MKLLLCVSLSLFVNCANAQELYVGIVGEGQSSVGISSKILFVKEGNRWLSVANKLYESEKYVIPDVTSINWTMAFDGRSLGQVKLVDPDPGKNFVNPWFYKRDKIFRVREPQRVPRIRNKLKQFGGWVRVPKYRPLVLVSKANYHDPDHWKPIEISSSVKRSLFVPLKLVMGRFNEYRCPGGPDVDKAVPYTFKHSDLVVYKAYSSSTNEKLVAVGMNTNLYGCDGPLPSAWGSNWFLLDGNDIEYLGRNMALVDAGDYDNDGKSEVLFWYSGYNRDGYILMYNSFTEKTEYLWSYH